MPSLLYGDTEVVNNRAATRDARKRGIPYGQALEESTARFQADWEQWQSLYNLPNNLYQPGAQDHNGTPFYDVEIDVTHLAKDQTAEVLHQALLESGLVERRNVVEPVQIFPVPVNGLFF
nr:hypothetical protein [uncultured bacterium]